jgi:hypothetical protein
MTLSISTTTPTPHKPRKTYINTVWAVRTYDVWGNARDGYEVNDAFSDGEVTIRCEVKTYNVGTEHQFDSAHPSDSQIRRALDLRRFAIDTDGDDLTIYVNRSRDGYPCGELQCVSHESLSPNSSNPSKKLKRSKNK